MGRLWEALSGDFKNVWIKHLNDIHSPHSPVTTSDENRLVNNPFTSEFEKYIPQTF